MQEASKKDKPFGYSLLLDMYGCRAKSCDDLAFCYQFLEDLVEHLGMQKQSPPFIFRTDKERYPDKAGLSGWIPLVESGIQLHTLTKKSFVSVDIYSCSYFAAKDVLAFTKEYFKPTKVEQRFLRRGKEYYHHNTRTKG